jgi:hypothetical protein
MSRLLEAPPYAARDHAALLAELNALDAHHRAGCPSYARIVAGHNEALSLQDLPFLHVGLFKRLELVTGGTPPQRTVLSSSTSGVASRVAIDMRSGALQARSSEAILADFIGSAKRPVLVLDSVSSLRQRNAFSARILAAMSLKPFASEILFLLNDAGDPASLQLAQLERALRDPGDLIVYGFSWMLWLAWARAEWPQAVMDALRRRRISFVHSGGWKKLEVVRVERASFEAALLERAGPGSTVLDYYGLAEQMGVVFPTCEHGSRHVPRWADVIVRDTWSLEPLATEPGQLQLMNVLAWGAPAHSVLTEDMGRLLPGTCGCGRKGRRFELLGRLPQAELRGCANV